jgi:hypothetical protein
MINPIIINAHHVSYLLSYHIRNVNQCQFHPITLLFSCSRSQGLRKQRTDILDMLYKAVEYTPRSFFDVCINSAMAMALPLQAAFYVPPSSTLPIPIKVKKNAGF